MMKKTLLTIAAFISIIYSHSQEFSLIHDGISRTYRLHIPDSYNADSLYPFVINMHGYGSNAIEEELYTGFNWVADTAGIVVAYPNGIDNTWNISSTTGTDDVGFISALIDTIDSQFSIDLNRVYATGMSMGGFMSYRLACELSDRIAAIASVTGLLALYPCDPNRPVPVLQIHGTADPMVPYAGVPSTISHWVNHNLCPGVPVTTDLPDIDTNDNSTVTVSYYGPCEESTEVILYTVNNGEHTWPGAVIIIGVTNQDINASVEIWNFFKKYNLQGSSGTGDYQSEPELACLFYPNPVSDLATVELVRETADHFDFRIFDITGKLVLEHRNLSDQRFLIDCSSIPPGFYIAAVYSEAMFYYQKIIIR